jgi:putative addiction module killer protein
LWPGNKDGQQAVSLIRETRGGSHVGTGWRVYFVQRGAQVIVLLAGGPERTQKTDIKRAKALATRLD